MAGHASSTAYTSALRFLRLISLRFKKISYPSYRYRPISQIPLPVA